MKKMLFIVNPKAGKNQVKPYLCDMIDMYVANGYEVTVHTTQCQKDAYNVAAIRGSAYDMIVCSGGDGTLDEVCSGLLQLDKAQRPLLGYIPAGTTNDFAKSLGITFGMMQAAQLVLDGEPFACDLGLFNDIPFVYVAAFGIFTQVSYTTPQNVKNSLGHLAYILEGIKSIASIQSYHVRCEYGDKVIEDDFIYGMVTNSISVGGFKSISGKVMQLNDGLLEILLVRMPRTLIDLNSILSALVTQKIDERYMYMIQTDHIRFVSEEELAWTLDGEDGGAHRTVDVYNLNKVVQIIRPKDAIESEGEIEIPKKIQEKIDVVVTSDKEEQTL